ncbi:hypothetical protein V5O48_013335 [Marasmius crinis-equi]|uniref:NmrA-like domain-containing protein n=1 Tax=Marasmius crinis-equi TaxID=585013 RepID=A0ABR3F0D4_9AGAR
MSSSSTSEKTIVLVTGATGYVGGSVLSRLLALPYAEEKYEFRAIVRDAGKAQKLELGFGVKTIVGSHSDQQLISKEAAEADVVLAMADCDDLDAADGINKGLKERFEITGKRPILIHISGADWAWNNVQTGVISDAAAGDYASDMIWDDENVSQLDSIAPDAFHRPAELKVLSADEEGYAKTYIVCPTLIYNAARNPLVDVGISNSRTSLFKMLILMAVKRDFGVTIGKGENLWANVHIGEVADFFVLLFNSALDNSKDLLHGREGYFFLGSDESKSVEFYSEISRILFNLGKIKSPTPTEVTEEEAVLFLGEGAGPLVRIMIGGNKRCVSTRARKLGWKPQKNTERMLGTMKDEVDFCLGTLE